MAACQLKLPKADPDPVVTEPSAPVRTIRKVELLRLQALNLSEDMSLFSTHDDEILFIAYLLRKDADSLRIVDSKMFKDLTFDSSKITYELPYQLEIEPETGSDHLAAFLLAELDNTGTENSIRDTFNRKITRYVDGRPPSRLALDSLFVPDDFLDLEFLRFDQPLETGEQKIIFKGMHLFDRFEYHLFYRAF